MSDSGDKIEELILSGALEVSGIDIDSGEMLYNFTDKLKICQIIFLQKLWLYGLRDF